MTVYTVTYNEQYMLPHFIAHYRRNFPGCRIVVYDNYSTDHTVKIAQASDCEVIYYDTDNQLNDLKYLEIKNHCWQIPNRQANADDVLFDDDLAHWVIVADCDEFCRITADELRKEHNKGVTIIRFQGYNMVRLPDSGTFGTGNELPGITHGISAPDYSKNYCFSALAISQINYNPGCHVSNPVGKIAFSKQEYPCYHYKYLDAGYLVARYTRNLQRMCQDNRRKGMGSHYAKNEKQIRDEVATVQQAALKIKEPDPLRLKIFINGFQDDHFARVPRTRSFQNVNLSKLAVGEYQDNRLSEHRLFLSQDFIPDEPETSEYIGLLTWRWHQKCKHFWPLHNLNQLYLTPDTVWTPWPGHNWYRHSLISHPGIQPYLEELAAFTGLKVEGTGLYGNQFICHKSVYFEFLEFFRICFHHFHKKYGYRYDFWVKDCDKPRLPAVFYERIACLWFCNQKHLNIKQIPHL